MKNAYWVLIAIGLAVVVLLVVKNKTTASSGSTYTYKGVTYLSKIWDTESGEIALLLWAKYSTGSQKDRIEWWPLSDMEFCLYPSGDWVAAPLDSELPD